MTSAICSPDNGLILNTHGFNLRIYSNKNMANSKHEYAINLRPNVEFSDKLIKEDNIHILFNIDNSCCSRRTCYSLSRCMDRRNEE